jgi:hypothetical protein
MRSCVPRVSVNQSYSKHTIQFGLPILDHCTCCIYVAKATTRKRPAASHAEPLTCIFLGSVPYSHVKPDAESTLPPDSLPALVPDVSSHRNTPYPSVLV